MNCNHCGRKSGGFNIVPFYSCMSPRCNEQGSTFCYVCLEKHFNVKVNFLKMPKVCPHCNIGKLKSHGT